MKSRSVHGAIAVTLALAVYFAGCGAQGPTTIPIRGEVLYKGAPLKNVPQGIVRYLPKTPDSGRQASGRLQADGSFVLTTFKASDGVVPGEYTITVSAYSREAPSRAEVEASGGAGMVAPKLMIPERYTDPNASGLSDVVDTNHSGFKRIELTE